MANFTPIATGAAANAAIVNAPLYELDSAITYLQSIGAIAATRPWAVIGGTAQPTSSDNVPVTADITHTGKLVRGQTTITSTGADMETRGNLAVGGGSHVFTGINACAIGEQNTVNARSLAVGIQNAAGLNSVTFGALNIGAAPYSILNGYSSSIDAGSVASSILGGIDNGISSASLYSIVCSGQENTITQVNYGFIGSGNNHLLGGNAHNSAIVSGVQNNLQGGAIGSLIAAGHSNFLIATYSAIVAGESNRTGNKPYVFIGAGVSNQVTASGGAIVTGNLNTITSPLYDSVYSLIGSGESNSIADSTYASIMGGKSNTINEGHYSTIAGGFTNQIASASYAGIVNGNNNSISGSSNGFVGGGNLNRISGSGSINSAIVGGINNQISGSACLALAGNSNVLSGSGSVGGGVAATITHNWAFLWNSNFDSDFNSVAHGEFSATASGGVRFFTNLARTTGMTMAAGTSSWSAVSAAALKGNFASVEQKTILDRLLSVPIQTYNFKDGTGGYHEAVNLGPTAEDWDAAFADLLGAKTIAIDDRKIPAISEGDKLGVALAAIQALTIQVNELKAKLN